MAAKKTEKKAEKKPEKSRKRKSAEHVAAVRKAEAKGRRDAVKAADVKEPFGKGNVLMRVIAPQGFGTNAIWCAKGDIIRVSTKQAEELDLERLASKLEGG